MVPFTHPFKTIAHSVEIQISNIVYQGKPQMDLNYEILLLYLAHHLKYESESELSPMEFLSRAKDLYMNNRKRANKILYLYREEIVTDIVLGEMSLFEFKSLEEDK